MSTYELIFQVLFVGFVVVLFYFLIAKSTKRPNDNENEQE